MIDELIEEEKKKASLRIQKKKQLESKIDLLSNKLIELEQKLGKNYPVPVVQQKFNFFQKIFSRKKYKDYTIKKQQDDADYQIAKKEEETWNIIQIDLMQLKKELLNLNNQIKKFDDENTIRIIEDREKAIIFLLEKYPNLQNDLNFMKEATKFNPKFIIYDKTDDPSLYIYVIDKAEEYNDRYIGANKEYRHQQQIYFEEEAEKLKKEISNPSQVSDGKYKIPPKYIYEAIREDYKSKNGIYLEEAFKYLQYDGQFPKEYGEELEKLWEDPDNIFGIHSVQRGYSTRMRMNGEDYDESPRLNVESIFKQRTKI